MAQVLVHGDIEATICEVHKLDAVVGSSTSLMQKLMESIISTIGVYATIYLDKVKIESRRVKDPANPKLEESFHIRCAHKASNIIFTLQCDKWYYSSDRIVIGHAYVPVEDIINGDQVDKWVDIVDESQNPIAGCPKIHVKLQFLDAKRHQNWAQGIKGPEFLGVPRTFFPQQKGCKVTLYQDAHVPENFAPRVFLDGGETYKPQRCWEDIFDAISEAKHFIYIAGWSLCTDISLVRDPKRGRDITLGELLKKKTTQDGVRVVLLLWNDKSSLFSISGNGMMDTHDKETERYFKGTGVHCVLCTPDGILMDPGSFSYTHHQKIVLVDSKLQGIVSFIGGIDLCSGRYDTQFHSLFRTLATDHSKDFHQPSIEGSTIEKGGPREPWHDVHCKLEGPIAWDVYSTFVQRFRKQVTDQSMLLSEEELKDFLVAPAQVTDAGDDDTWNVQLFRSIDETVTLGFPETSEDAFRFGLVSEESKMIDRGIQDAYIQAIRRAKNFIYIENQYFIGSDFGWSVDGIDQEHTDALNLIPKELSLKIVSKIKARERFVVYVVIPMWPEGVPNSGSVQKILCLQRRTIDMMYKDIFQALKEEGIDEHPQQYLAFFCLGNREMKNNEGEYVPPQLPDPNSDYLKSQEARRFMIYVHSKMMIVDDEYIIMGSANINQRSMDGGRDSEIAMGAYQPYHLANGQSGARGQIHGFRMSLWYEHLGIYEDAFLNPESKECINKVNELAKKYWDQYATESVMEDLPGHLLRYPLNISDYGTITEIEGLEFFLDTNACILGDNTSNILLFILPECVHDIQVAMPLRSLSMSPATMVEEVPFSTT